MVGFQQLTRFLDGKTNKGGLLLQGS
jgi:hypothetical protein